MLLRKFQTKIAKTLVAVCAMSCFLITQAQDQVSFRQLSVKDGLSQNSVVSIAQDSIGYLWIATQNGLNKYDGVHFSNYDFDFVDITRPTYSHLGKVYVDRKGTTFIIPLDKKVYKYNQLQDRFDTIEGLEDVSIMYQDHNMNYWIGTYRSGLFLFDADFKKIQTIIDANTLSGTVYDIAAINSNRLLLSTDQRYIEVSINTRHYEVIRPEGFTGDPLNENFSVSLSDTQGRQWIGTFGDGLYFKEPDSELLQRLDDLAFNDLMPNNLNILDLHQDRKGRLWVATYGDGLYLIEFAGKKITHFAPEKYNPKALHYKDILCIYEDYTGAIWFGTDGAGLSFYDESLEKFNSFTNLQTPESISIEVVRAITVAKDQTVWLGTSGKGLTEYETVTNSWRTFTTLNSKLLSDRIMSLFIDGEELWVGTQGNGLMFYNEKEGFSTPKALAAKTIWTIFRDSKRRIWLGTQANGLLQYDKEKGLVKQFSLETIGLPSNTVRVITEDSDGRLWIGTDDQGFFSFNPDSEDFNRYNDGPKAIKSLYLDSQKVLWAGTNGSGLKAYDIENNQFYSYSEADGLANNVIYAILPDQEGNLWLSSNKGITKFSPSKTWNKPQIKNYTNYAGLATEFNTGAYYKHRDGSLYFGGLEGYYWFNPKEIKEDTRLPKTTITQFEVLDNKRNLLDQTELKHTENTVAFGFSSMQFALPEKNQFQYRLLNFDDQWISASSNEVRYPRLTPGTYEFQVKSSNYDGLWNDTPATFSFKIRAPWYFNFYSKLAYTALLLLTFYGVYIYFRWRWQMKLNLQLQEQESVRLKLLNDYKSKLYTDVAHEFRTPLTLISAPIDAKLTDGSLSDYDLANFTGIKRNTNRLSALVDQLLQLAKLEQGKQRLKLAKGDLGSFLKTIVEPFQYKAELKKITLTSEIKKIKNSWYDEDAIEKIVSNLLSNAVKYTPEKGGCIIRAHSQNNKVYIEVKNSLDIALTVETEKLFDRFYQQNEYTEGVGVGLSLVKELVKLYKGMIHVTTNEFEINFNVVLPLDKEVFTEGEVEILKQRQLEPDTALLNTIDLAPETRIADNPILLVVEDNLEVRNFIVRSLKRKFQIIEASNGQEGLELALAHVPDIVLSDIRMPIKNGIELCNLLKKDDRTSHIPVILLTADTGEENEFKGLESGADDFINKPFKLRILEKRLDNLINLRKALRDRYSQEFILKPTDISLTSTDEVFLNKLQKVIDEEFSNPEFNALNFSKKLGMSRMQLHRKLLAYTGLSTSAFIRSQRLKQALYVLENSDATVNEVAYAVGFNTPSYFIKCFREAYDKTPLEYLNSIKN